MWNVSSQSLLKKYLKVKNSQHIAVTNNPRWVADRLKHEKGIKRLIYNRVKCRATHLRDRYIELARTVRKNMRRAKKNYEIRVAREAKSDPKCFF